MRHIFGLGVFASKQFKRCRESKIHNKLFSDPKLRIWTGIYSFLPPIVTWWYIYQFDIKISKMNRFVPYTFWINSKVWEELFGWHLDTRYLTHCSKTPMFHKIHIVPHLQVNQVLKRDRVSKEWNQVWGYSTINNLFLLTMVSTTLALLSAFW